jgi:transposase
MNAQEVSKLEIMQRLTRKQLRQKEAAKMLGSSIRQVKRILRAYREEGAQGLVSK